MKRDAEAIELVLKWLEENNPFHLDYDKQLLVSFSTGFTSTAGYAANAERAAEVGRQMQINLDRKSVRSTIQDLSSLRRFPRSMKRSSRKLTKVVQPTNQKMNKAWFFQH